MYVLDEPSIGLHQRDNGRLLETLKNLRDLSNSVIEWNTIRTPYLLPIMSWIWVPERASMAAQLSRKARRRRFSRIPARSQANTFPAGCPLACLKNAPNRKKIAGSE